MEDQIRFYKAQYELVQGSRWVLLEFCKTLSPADLLKENSSFGRGSIRNLLVHIANTYQFWIGRHGLKRNMEFTSYTTANTVDEIISLFRSIDELMIDFLNNTLQTGLQEIEYEIGGKAGKASPLQLFTHVITHEFHHKGQILSLSRHLDYVPVDTDVMR